MADPWNGLSGGRSLHDWLVESAYVRAHSDDSVNGKKRGRARRGKQRTDRESSKDRGVGSSDDQSAPTHVGNRRYRRWMNEKLLRELSGPLDAAQIGKLFCPPPWGDSDWQSPLERVLEEDASRALWEPFRNVDMDRQEVMLNRFARKTDSKTKQGREQTKNTSTPSSLAEQSWRSIQRHARDALRRSADCPILEQYEDKLLGFVDHLEKEPVEGSKEGNMETLLLPVQSAYHRLLIHGMSQFYGLLSTTVQSSDGRKVMVIRSPKQRKVPSAEKFETPSSSPDPSPSTSSSTPSAIRAACGRERAHMKLSVFLTARESLVSAAA